MRTYFKNSLSLLLAGYSYIATAENPEVPGMYEVQCLLNPASLAMTEVAPEAALLTEVKPFFREEADRLSVNMLSLDESPMYVRIYDESGELVYCEKVDQGMSLGRIYDFAPARSGQYLVQVRYKDNLYSSTHRVR